MNVSQTTYNLRSQMNTQHFLRSQCNGQCGHNHSNGNSTASQSLFSSAKSSLNKTKISPMKALPQSKKIRKVKDNTDTQPIKLNTKTAKKITKRRQAVARVKKTAIKPRQTVQVAVTRQKRVIVPKQQAVVTQPIVAQNTAILFPQKIVKAAPAKPLFTNLNLNIYRATKFDDDETFESCQIVTSKGGDMAIEGFDLEKKLTLSMKIDQKSLQLSSTNVLTVPINVILEVDTIDTANKAGLDLVFVIDKSGSMSGNKMQQVKDTFKCMLELLSEKDRLSIVVFNSEAYRITPLMRMTTVNKEKTLAQLNGVDASGGTSILNGMKQAFDILKQRRYVNDVTSICLLSDGLDSSGIDTQIKNQIEALGMKDPFTINSFGYGTDYDPKLMSSIATVKDGNFYFVEKLHSLDECFVDCIGNLYSAVAESVTIMVKAEQSFHPELKFSKAFGLDGTWKNSGDSCTTEMIHLISGRKKTFVLEMEIPKIGANQIQNLKEAKIATADVMMRGLKNTISPSVCKTVALQVAITHEDIKEDTLKEAMQMNEEVVFNHLRVKGAELLNEARKVADSRKFDDAKKMLEEFKEDVVNTHLEGTQTLLEDIDDAIGHVDPQVYDEKGKHYMYQNYKAQMEEKSTITRNTQNRSNLQCAMVEALNKKNNDNANNCALLRSFS